MKRQKFYWALGVLVMLFMVWFFYNVGPPLDTEQPPGSLPKPEQVAAPPILKAPPQGETFATGHWEGDQWQRTVPEAPATVMHDGKAMTLDELYKSAHQWSTGWAERVAILNRVIGKPPIQKRHIMPEYISQSVMKTESGFTIGLYVLSVWNRWWRIIQITQTCLKS